MTTGLQMSAFLVATITMMMVGGGDNA